MKWLSKWQPEIYAMLRMVSGFLFSFHGVQKIFGLFTDHQPELFSQMWIGGIIELVGGLAIMIGFQTQIFAFICSGMMAVAYFQFHWKFQGGSNLLPGVNRGESAVLYSFLFLFIATRGGGKWCLDKK